MTNTDDQIAMARSIIATLKQQIAHQTKVIEEARYIIDAFERGADHDDYGRDIWEWQQIANGKPAD